MSLMTIRTALFIESTSRSLVYGIYHPTTFSRPAKLIISLNENVGKKSFFMDLYCRIAGRKLCGKPDPQI